MSHELELDRSGRAAFCYNHRNGNPWHRLGESKPGGFTWAEGVQATRLDRTATTAKMFAADEHGVYDVDELLAVIWPTLDVDDDGNVIHERIGTVGAKYPLMQYRDILEIAMAVVGASHDQAILDTLGVLFGGRKFFAFIDFGDLLVTLPSGVVDRFVKGMGVMSSLDGSQSVTFWTTDTRALCNNTVEWGQLMAKNLVRIRHDGKASERLAQVPELLQLAIAGDAEFDAIVSQLDMQPGGARMLDKVVERLWPKPVGSDATDRSVKIWDNRRAKLEDLYYAESNQASMGDSGWAVWNTVAEFLDHVQGSDEISRAFQAIDLNSANTARKQEAAKVILAGAR